MAQADGVIQNDTGSSVRADLNNNIAAAFTNHSGATPPSTTYAYQWYVDTASNELKIRNGANNAYLTVGDVTAANLGLTPLSGATFTGAMQFTSGTAAAPGITFSSDTDTGLLRSAANTLQFTLGGTAPFTFTSTAFATTVPITFADGTAGAPSITNTGDTNCGLFFPSADKVGVSASGVHQYSFDETSIDVLLQNEVRFHDADSSNYAAIKAPTTLGADYTLTLPGNDGDAGQYLQTDGAGALSWQTVGQTAGVPAGSVFPFAAQTAPSGYLPCDGAAVSRTAYATLFAAIGTQWGAGDGSTTFNVPMLQGEFVRGWDDGRGVDSGRAFASAQADATAKNGLGITPASHNHTTDFYKGITPGSFNQYQTQYLTSQSTAGIPSFYLHTPTTTSVTLGLTAGDAETRPRNVAMLYIIKT